MYRQQEEAQATISQLKEEISLAQQATAEAHARLDPQYRKNLVTRWIISQCDMRQKDRVEKLKTDLTLKNRHIEEVCESVFDLFWIAKLENTIINLRSTQEPDESQLSFGWHSIFCLLIKLSKPQKHRLINKVRLWTKNCGNLRMSWPPNLLSWSESSKKRNTTKKHGSLSLRCVYSMLAFQSKNSPARARITCCTSTQRKVWKRQ